jgi:multiple sugar transport system permease protein
MKLGTIIRNLVLLLLGALWILPLYLFLINASTPPKEYGLKERWEFPQSFALLDNISSAWRLAHLGEAVFSTAMYAIVGGVVSVLLASLAAFAIVSLRIRYGFLWFLVLYAGTIFPFQMYLSPLYTMFVNWKIYNTHAGLLLFYTAIAIPFAVFVIRNHFTSVPIELGEAARLDGASSLRVYTNIFAPLSLNAFATVFILQFTWIWNDLLFGLTLSRSENIRPIMTALASLQG